MPWEACFFNNFRFSRFLWFCTTHLPAVMPWEACFLHRSEIQDFFFCTEPLPALVPWKVQGFVLVQFYALLPAPVSLPRPELAVQFSSVDRCSTLIFGMPSFGGARFSCWHLRFHVQLPKRVDHSVQLVLSLSRAVLGLLLGCSNVIAGQHWMLYLALCFRAAWVQFVCPIQLPVLDPSRRALIWVSLDVGADQRSNHCARV